MRVYIYTYIYVCVYTLPSLVHHYVYGIATLLLLLVSSLFLALGDDCGDASDAVPLSNTLSTVDSYMSVDLFADDSCSAAAATTRTTMTLTTTTATITGRRRRR